MSTNDVPGANPVNKDTLCVGCWAEHDDGSLIFVQSTEGGSVIYEMYDVAQDPPIKYQDSMLESSFKSQFSWSNGSSGVSIVKWIWHDKTPFPFSRVMSTFDRPVPEHVSARNQLSAAAMVAESLNLRAKELHASDVAHNTDRVESKIRTIGNKLIDVLESLAK